MAVRKRAGNAKKKHLRKLATPWSNTAPPLRKSLRYATRCRNLSVFRAPRIKAFVSRGANPDSLYFSRHFARHAHQRELSVTQ